MIRQRNFKGFYDQMQKRRNIQNHKIIIKYKFLIFQLAVLKFGRVFFYFASVLKNLKYGYPKSVGITLVSSFSFYRLLLPKL